MPESDVGLLISAAVARKVNPMDPLTALDYHLGLGVEVWLQLRGVKGDNAFQDPEVLKMPWLHDWAFDLCCQVLLISTLVRDEMSDAELFLVGHAADAAMFLRKFFFHPGFDDADPQRLARTLDDLKFERSIELAPLLLSARKVVLGELSDIKCDVQRLRDVFPRLMPGLSDSVIAGMRVAFQRRGS